MKRFIILNNNNKVIAERFGTTILDGEIESDNGAVGQIMQPDGSFVDPEPEPVEPLPTLEEMQMQTLLNTEYLVVMSEISNLV
jgi:hypothetical protein